MNPSGGWWPERPCGSVLYRVDDRPVLLLCGRVPAYRDVHSGDAGNDIRQLNRNLHDRGYDAAAGVAIEPDENAFTVGTQKALEVLQLDRGAPVTGELRIDDAVFLPESMRIAKVTGELGGAALPGAQLAQATSDAPEVQVQLDPSEQGAGEGRRPCADHAGGQPVDHRQGGAGRERYPGPSWTRCEARGRHHPRLRHPRRPGQGRRARAGLGSVEITTAGVENALSVPVTAIVGNAGGGFAVEVVRDHRRELVAVRLGLFDTGDGRVQVEGDLSEGDHVVVPSL